VGLGGVMGGCWEGGLNWVGLGAWGVVVGRDEVGLDGGLDGIMRQALRSPGLTAILPPTSR
jgi:hypothetical protein